MLSSAERSCTSEIFNAKLKHVQHMAIENAPKHKIIRSFLLVIANYKETTVIFDSLVFDKTGILHRCNVVRLPDEKLGHAWSSHHV